MKTFILFFLLIIFTFGCANQSLDREADLQGNHSPVLAEGELFVIAGYEQTVDHMRRFEMPEEIEGYRISYDDETLFVDEDGNEVSESDVRTHYFKFNVWTKETFEKSVTNTGDDGWSEESIKEFPNYTAAKIELVEMSDEEYLARRLADEEGYFSIIFYLGDEFEDDPNKYNSFIQMIDEKRSKIRQFTYTAFPSERLEVLLNIQSYPAFVIFDHEQLILKAYDEDQLMEFIERELSN
ncbi:hypothetical protein LGQ02_03640 [Bacillus shivajii]|uniref:hypothetical protein n=1 Tax=Bacillus shivajii TaxID=1983719 RepID=UPI001CFC27FE|nr:hypothetical protein [Bacillus shivajii]UCZ53888.1 hypothetical protein LGQ02_03640 [Bacillus shivajii]